MEEIPALFDNYYVRAFKQLQFVPTKRRKRLYPDVLTGTTMFVDDSGRTRRRAVAEQQQQRRRHSALRKTRAGRFAGKK